MVHGVVRVKMWIQLMRLFFVVWVGALSATLPVEEWPLLPQTVEVPLMTGGRLFLRWSDSHKYAQCVRQMGPDLFYCTFYHYMGRHKPFLRLEVAVHETSVSVSQIVARKAEDKRPPLVYHTGRVQPLVTERGLHLEGERQNLDIQPLLVEHEQVLYICFGKVAEERKDEPFCRQFQFWSSGAHRIKNVSEFLAYLTKGVLPKMNVSELNHHCHCSYQSVTTKIDVLTQDTGNKWCKALYHIGRCSFELTVCENKVHPRDTSYDLLTINVLSRCFKLTNCLREEQGLLDMRLMLEEYQAQDLIRSIIVGGWRIPLEHFCESAVFEPYFSQKNVEWRCHFAPNIVLQLGFEGNHQNGSMSIFNNRENKGHQCGVVYSVDANELRVGAYLERGECDTISMPGVFTSPQHLKTTHLERSGHAAPMFNVCFTLWPTDNEVTLYYKIVFGDQCQMALWWAKWHPYNCVSSCVWLPVPQNALEGHIITSWMRFEDEQSKACAMEVHVMTDWVLRLCLGGHGCQMQVCLFGRNGEYQPWCFMERYRSCLIVRGLSQNPQGGESDVTAVCVADGLPSSSPMEVQQ